jgi:glycolate oxidase iron-sulfur subunit
MSERTSKIAPDPDVARLANSLLELDDLLVSCMRCGLCQSVCPVYGVTMQEAGVSKLVSVRLEEASA